ncbi:unnamed protein product, partial [Prorocentrum cordatum]
EARLWRAQRRQARQAFEQEDTAEREGLVAAALEVQRVLRERAAAVARERAEEDRRAEWAASVTERTRSALSEGRARARCPFLEELRSSREAERAAREATAQRSAALLRRMAEEKVARAEAEQKATEEQRASEEAEQKAAEEQLAVEETARKASKEVKQKAADQQRATDEAVRQASEEAEQKAADEQRAMEAEQKAADEQRATAEQKAADEQRATAEQKAADEQRAAEAAARQACEAPADADEEADAEEEPPESARLASSLGDARDEESLAADGDLLQWFAPLQAALRARDAEQAVSEQRAGKEEAPVEDTPVEDEIGPADLRVQPSAGVPDAPLAKAEALLAAPAAEEGTLAADKLGPMDLQSQPSAGIPEAPPAKAEPPPAAPTAVELAALEEGTPAADELGPADLQSQLSAGIPEAPRAKAGPPPAAPTAVELAALEEGTPAADELGPADLQSQPSAGMPEAPPAKAEPPPAAPTAVELAALAPASTTLAQPAHPGDTRLSVASQEGFAVGDVVSITAGGHSETRTIAGFGSIIVHPPLSNGYQVGAVVARVSGPAEQVAAAEPRAAGEAEQRADAPSPAGRELEAPPAPAAAERSAERSAEEQGPAQGAEHRAEQEGREAGRAAERGAAPEREARLEAERAWRARELEAERQAEWRVQQAEQKALQAEQRAVEDQKARLAAEWRAAQEREARLETEKALKVLELEVERQARGAAEQRAAEGLRAREEAERRADDERRAREEAERQLREALRMQTSARGGGREEPTPASPRAPAPPAPAPPPAPPQAQGAAVERSEQEAEGRQEAEQRVPPPEARGELDASAGPDTNDEAAVQDALQLTLKTTFDTTAPEEASEWSLSSGVAELSWVVGSEFLDELGDAVLDVGPCFSEVDLGAPSTPGTSPRQSRPVRPRPAALPAEAIPEGPAEGPLAELPPPERPDDDGPGTYWVVSAGVAGTVPVTAGRSCASTTVGEVRAGTIVGALAIHEDSDQGCRRAQIASPGGWITLLDTGSGCRFARRVSEDGPGGYAVVSTGSASLLPVTESAERESRVVAELGTGSCVAVVELAPRLVAGRLRARIVIPAAGWVTVLDAASRLRFLERDEGEHQAEATPPAELMEADSPGDYRVTSAGPLDELPVTAAFERGSERMGGLGVGERLTALEVPEALEGGRAPPADSSTDSAGGEAASYGYDLEAEGSAETRLAEDLIGRSVVITGLVQTPQYNGQLGKVEAFDAQLQRYAVLVRGAAGTELAGQAVTAKLRRENLTAPAELATAAPTPRRGRDELGRRGARSPTQGILASER